jgi:hypothetical protein
MHLASSLPSRLERSMESGANHDKGNPREQYLPHISSSAVIGADDLIVAGLTRRTATIGARISGSFANPKAGLCA